MDNLTKQQRKKTMQSIRSKNTKPERIIYGMLRKRGIKFSRHAKNLPGKPDICFRHDKVIVFIDSDYWHGHPTRFIMPATNRKYWKTKIENNRARDKRVNNELRKCGWRVLRFWDYDIKRDLGKVMKKIAVALDTDIRLEEK